MWPMWQVVLMGIIAVVSVLPFRTARGVARWPMVLPLLSLALWVAYEIELKSRGDGPLIRIDLAIVPVVFLVSCVGVTVWQVVLRRENKR